MAVKVAPRDDGNKLITDDTPKVNIDTVDKGTKRKVYQTKKQLDENFNELDLRRAAVSSGLGYVDLYGYPINVANLTMIKKEDAEQFRLGIFDRAEQTLKIATPDESLDNKDIIIDDLKSRGYEIKYYLCSEKSFEKLIKTYDLSVERRVVKDDLKLNKEDLEELLGSLNNHEDLKNRYAGHEHMSISDLFQMMLVGAYKFDASDIHIEPEKDDTTVRYRIDGIMYEFGRISRETQYRIESRIKLISNLKLNVNNIPQDGRFSFVIEDHTIDIRVSMLPSNYGYSIVMRLLGKINTELDYEALGFVPPYLQIVQKQAENPIGLTLATGPTGSGKTTSLYTILSTLNDGQNKIITLEDPIEYKIAGISQTQIDKPAGYTFASGLRSILRQDPDIVMVGEIRDTETAEVAIDASLTGHKVLSTLHTNDAVGAISRLIELDADGYSMADSINMVIGQRLARRLCQNCKYETKITDEQKEFVIKNLDSLPAEYQELVPDQLTFWSSESCEKCNNLGYKGRLGIYEVVTISDDMRQIITSPNPSIVNLRKIAYRDHANMAQDGILKAMNGLTDLEELMTKVSV